MLGQGRASVGSELGGVAEIRHSIGGWLRDWDMSGLVEDVELVASELITNAILHAGGEIDVVVERRGEGVRVLVRDGRPDLVPTRQAPAPEPVVPEDDLERLALSVLEGTTTGRGLLLVDAFSDAWGVELASSGKEVWAELGTGRSPEVAEPTGPTPTPPGGVGVALRSVPVRLVLLSAAHLDDLIRELQTTDFGGGEAADLATVGERLGQETLAQREPVRLAARDALRRRARRIDLDLEVPPAQVAVLRHFVSLSDQVEGLCRTGVLLTEAPAAEVTAFRRWYVDELERQVHGLPPTRCPFAE